MLSFLSNVFHIFLWKINFYYAEELNSLLMCLFHEFEFHKQDSWSKITSNFKPIEVRILHEDVVVVFFFFWCCSLHPIKSHFEKILKYFLYYFKYSIDAAIISEISNGKTNLVVTLLVYSLHTLYPLWS